MIRGCHEIVEHRHARAGTVVDRIGLVVAGSRLVSASRGATRDHHVTVGAGRSGRRGSSARYDITEFPATVGKGSAANVRIEGNTAISRVHLLVRYTGQCFAVEDKNSTNGTCINGNRLEPGELVKLKNGDKLKMGNEVFTVEIR